MPLASAYIPGELVQIYALVTYNQAPVLNKQVAFTVFDPNGSVIAVRTAFTNASGYAYCEYRTPILDNGTINSGIWSVFASVEVSQIVVSDTVSFSYNYPVILQIGGISVPASVARNSTLNIGITLQNLGSTAWSCLTITIYDNAKVPIGSLIVNSNSIIGNTVSAKILIPTWAFVGTAIVYVNILTNDPASGGVPVCPEQSAQFQIVE